MKRQLALITFGIHAGSRSIKDFVELNKPFLALCDHIHEAQGTDTLDGSFIVNPGPLNRNQYATVEVDGEIEVEFHISSCSKKG